MDKPLTPAELKDAMRSLPGWKYQGNALVRKFAFGNFREAFGFMTRVAFEAEAMDHHPEWTNVYDEVTIRLTTHHAGNKVTGKDKELAQRIGRILAVTPVK